MYLVNDRIFPSELNGSYIRKGKHEYVYHKTE